MQNRPYQDPEQYDDSGYGRSPYQPHNRNNGYYNPLPTERDTYENRHPHQPVSGYRAPHEERFANPNAGYVSGYQNPVNQARNAAGTYNRGVLDRFGNGRRGESIARGNYGIPGSDRFGNVWYHDPRNQGHYSGEYTERGLADQFGDELRSWFGNKEAARRREMDSRHAIGGRQGEWPQANRHYDDDAGLNWENRRYRDDQNRW